MNAVEKMYQRWEGYIADAEMNDQFREDCLEAEQQIKELQTKITSMQEKYDENGHDFPLIIKLQRMDQHIDMGFSINQQQIKELEESNKTEDEQYSEWITRLTNQIKELKGFAQHKPECQYWADIKAVKSNLLPNLRPDCNCGLKQSLNQ